MVGQSFHQIQIVLKAAKFCKLARLLIQNVTTKIWVSEVAHGDLAVFLLAFCVNVFKIAASAISASSKLVKTADHGGHFGALLLKYVFQYF
jgi:hypothetical protein